MPSTHTYHCLCTSLVLASTHTLSTLPTRTSLDKAIILPLPSSPSSSIDSDFSQSSTGYTILLSLTADQRPTIIRREDGFEKRFLHRCGRCRLVLGYSLDDSHYTAEKIKVLYILPGGVMSSKVMEQGRKIEETEVELGENVATVGVWE